MLPAVATLAAVQLPQVACFVQQKAEEYRARACAKKTNKDPLNARGESAVVGRNRSGEIKTEKKQNSWRWLDNKGTTINFSVSHPGSVRKPMRACENKKQSPQNKHAYPYTYTCNPTFIFMILIRPHQKKCPVSGRKVEEDRVGRSVQNFVWTFKFLPWLTTQYPPDVEQQCSTPIQVILLSCISATGSSW